MNPGCVKFSSVVCAAMLVAACGGGGGDGGTSPSAAPVPPSALITYTIGGTVSGMLGTSLVLTDGFDNITVNADGSFILPTALPSGIPYSVTVGTQPSSPAQRCTVTNGSGTVGNSNVTNVQVVCRNTIGGTTSGLVGTVVLQNNGGDNLSVSGGAFTFATALSNGSAYNVTVLSSSTAQQCTVSNGNGTANGNVTNIQVVCRNTIGGTVAGLTGTVVLQNNGGDNLSVTANGGFTFATTLATGSIYSVSVLTQPAGQTCRVTANGTGYANGSITNVQVRCVNGQWTWKSGSSTGSQGGVYGTKGVAAAANVPGSRNGATSWTDGSGNLWLFGGGGYAGVTTGYMNDLWKYNIASGQWTWVSGSNVAAPAQVGVYGTKGTAAPTNVPGARYSAVGWIDNSGSLWLFGGFGYPSNEFADLLNDLWKYDPGNNQWTWMGGSNIAGQPGVYGTKGIADAANLPGARQGAVGWFDATNNVLALFGGYGHSTGFLLGDRNDLWKYSVTNNQWTWVNGGNSVVEAGVYGTKGVAAPANVPGSRERAVGWKDGAGNLWVFGGNGQDASGVYGELNDLWKFDGTQWTWMSGATARDQAGIYGSFGVPDANNVPGGRHGMVGWTDSSGNFWLYGGNGYASIDYYQSGLFPGQLGDLWKFNGSTWVWMNGAEIPNQAGSYGTLGVAGTGVPGMRESASAWTDANNNLWLFGGAAFSILNDLWRFK